MSFPADLKYTKDHEWVRFEGDDLATIGITGYALEQLSDVVHMELPQVGETYEGGAPFGTVESTKTVSDLYMPVAGEVVETNEGLIDELEKMQSAPYTDGWLVKVRYKEADMDSLMSSDAYEAFISE